MLNIYYHPLFILPLSRTWMGSIPAVPSFWEIHKLATLMASGTLRVGWSLATWAAFFAMAFRYALSLGMLGVR